MGREEGFICSKPGVVELIKKLFYQTTYKASDAELHSSSTEQDNCMEPRWAQSPDGELVEPSGLSGASGLR